MSKKTFRVGFQTRQGRVERVRKPDGGFEIVKKNSVGKIVERVPDRSAPLPPFPPRAPRSPLPLAPKPATAPIPTDPEAFAEWLLEEDATIMEYLAK